MINFTFQKEISDIPMILPVEMFIVEEETAAPEFTEEINEIVPTMQEEAVEEIKESGIPLKLESQETMELLATALYTVAGDDYLEILDGIFEEIGPRPYQVELYLAFVSPFKKDVRNDLVLQMYQIVQERFPMYSGNPDLQNLVANISLNTLGYDAYLGEMAKLAELYNTDSKWWKENQNGDPAILNRTLDYIEVGLKSFASKLYDEDDIDGEINPPIEYKLHMISNFGEWWYPQHKSVYQKMLIEALN